MLGLRHLYFGRNPGHDRLLVRLVSVICRRRAHIGQQVFVLPFLRKAHAEWSDSLLPLVSSHLGGLAMAGILNNYFMSTVVPLVPSLFVARLHVVIDLSRVEC